MRTGTVYQSTKGLSLAVALLLALSGTTALADEKQDAEYRTTVMSTIDGHVKAIGLIIDGKVSFTHHLVDHAVAVVGTSRGLLEIFPDASETKPDKKDTKAKEEEKEKEAESSPFDKVALEFNTAAARLVQVLPSGDQALIKSHYEVLKKAHANLKERTAKQ